MMHLLPGRLRIKSDAIKGRPATEHAVSGMLLRVPGVLTVRTNGITGSVTITFDEDRISGYAILNALIDVGAVSNVIPLPRRTTPRQTEMVLSPAQKKLLLRLAGAAFKLALPVVVERCLGKSASRLISSML
jgi:hypothetical protein